MRDLGGWLAPPEPVAPDLVAPFLALAGDGPLAVPRELRRRDAPVARRDPGLAVAHASGDSA